MIIHNWKDAKDYYISAGWLSGVSMEDTAELFDIPYQSVRRRASKEMWRLERERLSVDDSCRTVDEYIYYYK